MKEHLLIFRNANKIPQIILIYLGRRAFIADVFSEENQCMSQLLLALKDQEFVSWDFQWEVFHCCFTQSWAFVALCVALVDSSNNSMVLCFWRLKSETGFRWDKLFFTVQCTVQGGGSGRGGGVQWRPWGGWVRVGRTAGHKEGEMAQFTVWLYPLSSGWSVAARGPAWSRRSPGSVVAPAPSSPLFPWPVWPAALLF